MIETSFCLRSSFVARAKSVSLACNGRAMALMRLDQRKRGRLS
jgi:hypothetical protein